MNENLEKERAEELFSKYANYVYRGALFLTGSKERAEDITQEVFVQVIIKYYTYDESKPFKPWIYKIMLNKVRNTVSRIKKSISLSEEIISIDSIGFSTNIEDNFLRQEKGEELWIAIMRLSIKSREVIYMHYYLEMPLEEIATTLDIPVGTCKSRLNTGLTALRKRVKKEGKRNRGEDFNCLIKT